MVNLLDIHPLNFEEFLDAVEPALYAYYDNIQKNQQIEEIFHNRLLEAYNNYLIIGGMPECVASWIKYKDPSKISRIQRELIEVYENDFSKHNGKVNSGRILMVFRSIVSQLAKPNEKFMYGTEIIPVETKGGEDTSAPSFKRYIAKNQPEYAIRFSKRGYRKDGDFTNIPVYLACKTKELL